VLLSIDPVAYSRLVAEYATGHKTGPGPTWDHPSTRLALGRLAALWQIEGAFPGGAERALDTQFDQSVLDVFSYRRAAMVAGADFFWPIITQYSSFPPQRVRWFRFPSRTGEQPPAMVGGDAAVLFQREDGNPGGRKLIEWLTTPQAARIWAGSGGFLSINDQVTRENYPYPPGMNADLLISEIRRGSQAGGVAFDLADRLGGRLGGGDGAGTWKIFTDFFIDVTIRRSDVGTAIDAAIQGLNGGAG
jgi:ABC-type glycerol-3-phosphate transport system substrate-binding protein